MVLSQCGGSNRGGFNILASNTKRTIQLDGVFNIISYDIVPKFQDVLMASEFKVSILDYLKLYFDKRGIFPHDSFFLRFKLPPLAFHNSSLFPIAVLLLDLMGLCRNFFYVNDILLA